MGSLFQKLQAEARRKGLVARSEESREWFREKARGLRTVKPARILKDDTLVDRPRPLPGRMFMFTYDPKYRETLPYYDTFPLILMVEPADKGFYGLNLHYIPPMVRAQLLDKLMETANNTRFDATTKLKINYNLLSSVRNYREFEPCFKHYLTRHLTSRVVQINPSEWDIAIFLPTEQFQKKTKQYVWNQSKKMYRS